MKILSVTLQNLNSLVGVWTIDLSDPAFASSGIFAITGPTGAGKSTLLDAICLALYGQTPRLGKITPRENEAMSRQTGECDAEVTFSCSSGIYTCKWHQHRSRKSPDGTLQIASHEISDASGRILSKKISEVADIVEKKTGLSFERFTRSVMLAQGRFSAFLEAGADARGPILEQITGTAIYSDISKAVHERVRIEEATLKTLLGSSEQLQVLENAVRAEHVSTLNAMQTELCELQKQADSIQTAIAWRQSIESLENEITELTLKQKEITQQQQAFHPKRQRLKWAQKAATLDAIFREMSLKRGQLADAKQMLATLQKKRTLVAAEAAQRRDAQTALEQQLLDIKAAQQADSDAQQVVRQLDTQITHLDASMADARKSTERHQHRVADTRRKSERIHEGLCQLGTATAQAREYLNNHAGDEQLAPLIGVMDAHLRHIQILNENLSDKQTAQGTIKSQIDSLEKENRRRHAAIEDMHRRVAKLQADMEQRRNDIEAQLAGVSLKARRELHMGLIEKRHLTDRIVQLEDERQRLEDGMPCPLCGATEHPYAKGQHPQLQEVDVQIETSAQFIARIELEEAALAECTDALTKQQNALKQQEFEVAQTSHRAADLRTQQIDITGEITKLQTQHNAAINELRQQIAPFIDNAATTGDLTDAVQQLRQRDALIRDARQTIDAAAQKEQQLQLEQKELKTTIAEVETVISGNWNEISRMERERQSLAENRRRLYGVKSPDEETALWRKRMQEAEMACRQEQIKLAAVQTEKTRLDAATEDLTEKMAVYRSECDAVAAEFQSRCTSLGFPDETAYVAAQMTPTALRALENEALTLDDQEKSCHTLLANLNQRLTTALQQAVTQESTAVLQAELGRIRDVATGRQETLGAIKQILSDDDTRRKKASAVQTQIDDQRRTLLRWQRLHELIGSADGKKYRNFAQSLTFNRLIHQANQQLSKMTDRYLLHPDEHDALAFSVMDNYQAGEFRSTKNLSGGESFIVSLALALGLARMSSKDVQIDSLFLDEGFGTLDDEALDTALDTLSRLHQEGKLIGIISHVPALRERISCRIQVMPVSGGISRLEGPGCRKGR
ncbi:MAG: AAA family ATPase [Deltaproteobacteria bacterium]|nr:AAA family ATPase [Deltaproteobacteria bacterium]